MSVVGVVEGDDLLNRRVQLKPHVHISERVYRGESWFVLSDAMNSHYFRCDALVRQFLQSLDGVMTIEEALAGFDDELGQEDVVRLIAALIEADMMTGDFNDSADVVHDRHSQQSARRWRSKLTRPFSIQLALINPARMLEALAPLGRLIFHPLVLTVSLGLVLFAAINAAGDTTRLVDHFSSRFVDPANLLTLWFLYPLLKLVHELGHGIATRHFNGEVREMGVMLLVFIPVPYVDASASTAFDNKYHRMLVAGAGIIVELWVAAIAYVVWSQSNPGLVGDMAFNLMLIGGLSTVLFNGNPLLRFDGYYVLSDYLEMPNLYSRAFSYLGYHLQQRVFRLKSARSPMTGQGEAPWLFAYGLAAGIYRVVIGVVIILFVLSQFFAIGVVLAVWYVASQWCWPIYRSLERLVGRAIEESATIRVVLTLAGITGLLASALFLTPFPHRTYAEGIVTVPEQNLVRTATEGFLVSRHATPGDVKREDILLQLRNDELVLRHTQVAAQLEEARIQYGRLLSGGQRRGNSSNRVEGEIAREDVLLLEESLRELERQTAVLTVTSPLAGAFRFMIYDDHIGRFLERGTPVGYFLDGEEHAATVAVAQADMENIQSGLIDVKIRLVSGPARSISASLGSTDVQTSYQLPAPVLGSARGGQIAVDMTDPMGVTAIDPVFLMTLQFQTNEPVYVGQRLRILFSHSAVPIGYRWLRGIREHIMLAYLSSYQ